MINLPDTVATRAQYTRHGNHHGRGVRVREDIFTSQSWLRQSSKERSCDNGLLSTLFTARPFTRSPVGYRIVRHSFTTHLMRRECVTVRPYLPSQEQDIEKRTCRMRIAYSDFTTPPPTWAEIFGNTNPVEVEIGFGKGAFLLALARTQPEKNFFGVEFAKRLSFRLARLIERDGPSNAIAIHADFTCLVRTMIWPESVSAYHLYFPDPWWKRRHRQRRLLQADFPPALVRTLARGGTIFLASDVHEYFEEIVQRFGKIASLSRFSWERDQVNKRGKLILTDFERKYRKEGRPIFYTGFRKVQ